MPFKECPECNEKYGPRTLKCVCGHEFRKGVPKLMKKKDIEPANDMVFRGETSLAEPEEKVTKKIKCDGKITIEELERALDPLKSTRNDNILTLENSVFVRGHLSGPIHNNKLILPFNSVFGKIVADENEGTLSIWIIDDRGDPDIIYMGAVAKT